MNTQEFIEKAKLIHGDEYDYSETIYINRETKVKIKCNKCKKVFEQKYDNHIHKTHPQGCPNCYGHKRKTTEEFIEKSKKIWGEDWYDYSLVEYKNNKTKVQLKCKKHNYMFLQTPKKHYLGQGCKFCELKSKGENEIDKFLRKNNVEFIREFRFDECKYKNTLPFDFYLPNINTVIEFQGIQHYKQQRRNKNETLEERKLKDKIKREFCLNNNIKEIEIKYDENILTKLIDYNIINKKEETNGTTNKCVFGRQKLF